MEKFDYIIAGSGAAGLGLAYLLSLSPLCDKKVLIIDKERKTVNDHTWCYWANRQGPFDSIAFRRWNKIEFFSQYFHQEIFLGDYQYFMIRAVDFYTHIHRKLSQFPNFEFLYTPITRFSDEDDTAYVNTEKGLFEADWIFDSSFLPQNLIVDESKFHFLKQHFLGWQITTDQPFFNPEVVSLFDFNILQTHDMRFIYTLPYNAYNGLVEFTLFSHELLQKQTYREVLSDYFQKKGIKYQINEEEYGVIPMTDQPFTNRQGKHIVNIGTKAGMVKPSTGYAFKRIQDNNARIVQSILDTGNPILPDRQQNRYSLYDQILLEILSREGHLSEKIFSDLFRNNSIQRIFRFLDEEGSFLENLQLITSLPPWPFIRAFYRNFINNHNIYTTLL
jgi:lycopene beta-cyclase